MSLILSRLTLAATSGSSHRSIAALTSARIAAGYPPNPIAAAPESAQR